MTPHFFQPAAISFRSQFPSSPVTGQPNLSSISRRVKFIMMQDLVSVSLRIPALSLTLKTEDLTRDSHLIEK